MWLASSDSGLDRFDPATEEFTLYKNTLDDDRSLAHDRVYSVYVDRSGAVWAATFRGLDRFNPTDRSFVHYNVRDGLPANTTLGVLEDDRGYLWVTTTNGLAQFDPRTRTSTNYDPSDGLPTDLFSVLVAAAKSRSGEFFFGSYNGLVAVSPNRLRINHVAPPVVIEQITADRKTYNATQGLRLPSRVRDLAIEYTALSFVAPEKVGFRYKLEGYDDDWQESGSRRQAFYTDLSPGGYRFRVIARNNSGVWNDAGAALDFSIAPAYYQTAWFRTLTVAILLSLLWAAHQYGCAAVAHEFDLRSTRASASARALRGSCTTRCCRASTVCCCDSRPRCTCCRIARQTRKSNWLVRLITRRRRSRKGAMPCRDYGPPPSKRTISLWRSARWEQNSRPTAAPTGLPHSVSPSKARRESSIRFFVTRSTRLLRKRFGMPSATRMPDGSRSRSATTTSNSDCACATMARGSIRRCSQTRVLRDTTDCAACQNALR